MLNVGKRIRELRCENNLTQAQLAKMINVSPTAIDYWERNVNEPKISYVILLVKVFGVTYDEFFEE